MARGKEISPPNPTRCIPIINQNASIYFPVVLILARTELIFIPVAHMVLCFGSLNKTVDNAGMF